MGNGATLELIPVVLGGFVCLVGLGLVLDAWTPDAILVKQERRRKPRVERSRGGEAMVGIGVICMGAAFIGRDTWVYSVVTVIAGAVFLILGAIANRKYLGLLVGNRGPLRRRDQG
jgi:hypothetical protein